MWKKWTEKEDEYLRKHWEMPNDILAAYLERSYDAIKARRSMLGIPSGEWEGVKMPEAMSKSEKEMRILRMANEMRVRLLG